MAQAVIGANPTPVDDAFWGARAHGVAQLERVLARLRRAEDAHAREQGLIVARASVLNLVVYATREIHARRAARTVSELARRHPSRAIVVVADRERRPGVDAEITMHSHRPQDEQSRQVSYEQILIRARGDSDERLASAVIPLLLPDLPVFLWWTDTPPSDRRQFDDLLVLANRLIVDSEDFARPEETLARLSSICGRGAGHFGVTDFNWTRLTPWRELVAAFFDVPAWRPFLDGITGIRVGFAVDADGRAIHPSQALLLIGWLASRLGWRSTERLAPSEAGGMLFAMERADRAEVQVRVRPRYEQGLEEGHVSGLRIQCTREGTSAEFVVKRTPDMRHVATTTIIGGRTVAQRTVPLATPSVTDLLGEELTIVASDRIYEASLVSLVGFA